MTDPRDLIAENAAALHEAMAAVSGARTDRRPEWLAVDAGVSPRRNRVLLTAPVEDAERLVAGLRDFYAGNPRGGGIRIEDPYGTLDLAPYGFRRAWRMPAMMRQPGPVDALGDVDLEATSGVAVFRVFDEEELADAERAIVDGFPYPDLRPVRPGLFAPAGLLAVPGLAFWVGQRSYEVAGAGVTFHNGSSVGVYWLATLAEHRHRGVARVILTMMLRRNPDVPAVLTATDAGLALYTSLGFAHLGDASWWDVADRATLS
ncbi:MAG: hypothetical protein GEV03_01165 [Streptosporangiales bacterium]|nr:hypothetical protein [Streptosporangiales bacterium]